MANAPDARFAVLATKAQVCAYDGLSEQEWPGGAAGDHGMHPRDVAFSAHRECDWRSPALEGTVTDNGWSLI